MGLLLLQLQRIFLFKHGARSTSTTIAQNILVEAWGDIAVEPNSSMKMSTKCLKCSVDMISTQHMRHIMYSCLTHSYVIFAYQVVANILWIIQIWEKEAAGMEGQIRRTTKVDVVNDCNVMRHCDVIRVILTS